MANSLIYTLPYLQSTYYDSMQAAYGFTHVQMGNLVSAYGIFNIFEYDSSLQYNQELMNKDIEEYGLFTYEDFAHLVSEDIFNSFTTQYFTVAIAKGILTWDQLYYYIERYAPLM